MLLEDERRQADERERSEGWRAHALLPSAARITAADGEEQQHLRRMLQIGVQAARTGWPVRRYASQCPVSTPAATTGETTSHTQVRFTRR